MMEWKEEVVKVEWREEVEDAKWKENDARGEIQFSLSEPRVHEGECGSGVSKLDTDTSPVSDSP